MENKEKIEGVCYICGEPLVWDENDENCVTDDYLAEEEGTIVRQIRCPHCGTLYEYYITKENIETMENDEPYIACGDQGFGNGICCGHTLAWSGDFMRSDFYDDPCDENNRLSDDDDAIVRNLVCSGCGCSIEVWEPTPNEIKSGKYPYWNEENENG